jgi:hypothetical protein
MKLGRVSFSQMMFEAEMAYCAEFAFCCNASGVKLVEYVTGTLTAVVRFTSRVKIPD